MTPLGLPEVEGAVVAWDVETSGLHPDDGARVSMVSIAWRGPGGVEAMVFPFDQGPLADKTEHNGLIQPSLWDTELEASQLGSGAWHRLGAWLGRQRLVGHNVKFDLLMARAGLRPRSGRDKVEGWDLVNSVVWDTLLAESLLSPGQKLGLKEIGARLWGEAVKMPQGRLSKILAKNGQRFDLVPLEEIEEYAMQDAYLTLQLYEDQIRRINEGAAEGSLIEREIDLMRVLTRMEMRGVGFDREGAWAAARTIEAEQRRLADELPFQPPTLTAAKRFFFGAGGRIPSKVTDRGAPQLDEEVLRQLVKERVPGAATFARYRNLDSARTKWYGAWPSLAGEDGRLRTVFQQTRVVSGRLAVKRVQLQAIPHEHQTALPPDVPSVRGLFRAGEGCELWEIDLSQAEIRVATAYSQCRAMREQLERGEDAHDATTRLVFQVEKEDPRWHELRLIAKRLNFAIIYGAGAKVLAEQVALFSGQRVEMHQAQAWLGAYRSAFPEFQRFAREAESRAAKRGWVQLISGRRRWLDPVEHHKAFNALIQGGVAEVMKDVMIRVEREWPGVMLLQIHDSVLLELPGIAAPEGVRAVRRIMENEFERAFGIGFKTDCKQWT